MVDVLVVVVAVEAAAVEAAAVVIRAELGNIVMVVEVVKRSRNGG